MNRPRITALLIAWLLLIGLAGGTAIWLQFTYAPLPPEAPPAAAVPRVASGPVSVPLPAKAPLAAAVPRVASGPASVPLQAKAPPAAAVPRVASGPASVPSPAKAPPAAAVPRVASGPASVPSPAKAPPAAAVPRVASGPASVPLPAKAPPAAAVPRVASGPASVPSPAKAPLAAAAPEALSGETEASPGVPDKPSVFIRGPGALVAALEPELTEESERGPPPRIALDGRQPWQVHARPFDRNDTRPRIAVVISGLGRSAAATRAAIQNLPGGVTLAFLPYGPDLQDWIDRARAAGHEVLLNLPMEPLDYPNSDPGPKALFTALPAQDNIDRLEWALSRVAGYVGVTSHMGSRFTASPEAMMPVIRALKDRGLLFLDSLASARSVGVYLASVEGVPRVINDRFLDSGGASRAAIDARLTEVERLARATGASIAVGQSYPVTLERVAAWIATLDNKGIAVAPVSALINRQGDRQGDRQAMR